MAMSSPSRRLGREFSRGRRVSLHGPLFSTYVLAFQKITVLKMAELSMLSRPSSGFAGAGGGARPSSAEVHPGSEDAADLIRSLIAIKQTSWKVLIEPLILFDQVLRDDPAGAYPRMDYDSRGYTVKSLSISRITATAPN